ncbi:MAG: glycosyltransferase family 39 protein, partial [Chloroflexota bacterium]|nr:glycosyltransferase family 39 protein [Chloroflexota bacterium]
MIGWRGWALLLVIILLGAWLRWTALASDGRFHPDEALFATFARRAALNGDWLLPGALDKPPLSIYAMTIAMMPFTETRPDGLPDLTTRGGEIAARLPGALASLLLIPLVYALARRVYADKFTALVPAALIAVSPFAVGYSATAFSDGMLLLWLTAALYTAVSQRWGWTGACMALAFASKQQALFYLPLVMTIGLLTQRRGEHRDGERDTGGRPSGASLQNFFASFVPLRFNSPPLSFLLTFGVGVALLILWDTARGQPTGFFALGIANNDPARLIRSDELVPRLTTWASHTTTLLAPATIPLML